MRLSFLSLFKQEYNAGKIISFFYRKKLELLEKNIEKEPQRQRPKLKNIFIKYLQRIYDLPGI